MKAYLDLMLINQVLMSIGAMHMQEALFMKKEKRRKILGISILLSLRIIAIYFNVYFSYLIFTLYDVLIFLIFYRKAFIKRILVYYLYLIIVNTLCLLMFKNDLKMKHQILVITTMKGGFAILLQPILYLFTSLSTLIVDKLYHLRDFKMDVLISSGKEDQVIKAYFDSGNTLRLLKSPVIFIKKGVMEFNDEDEVEVDITIPLPYYPEKAYRVLVSSGPSDESCIALALIVKKEADFYGCDCLFNALLRR